MRSTVVVIGAGMAGLIAARTLAERHDVVVLDKGRGVGGRMATRRIGDATFDHGAQFLTTHSSTFERLVQQWCDTGVVQPWFHGRLGPDGVGERDGHPRYRGAPTMTAIAKHLAAGLDVRTSCRVERLEQHGDGWIVRASGRVELEASAVVLTAPVPQSLELLDGSGVELDPADRTALDAVTYEPCLAALVPLSGPSELAAPGALAPERGPIELLCDNAVKGVSASPGLTVHAGAHFSATHLDAPEHDVLAELVGAAGLSGAELGTAQLETAQLVRWRYARPTEVHPDRSLRLSGLAPLVLAGDGFGGAKVEGAALSGLDAGRAVLELLSADT